MENNIVILTVELICMFNKIELHNLLLICIEIFKKKKRNSFPHIHTFMWKHIYLQQKLIIIITVFKQQINKLTNHDLKANKRKKIN